jgi:alginate O-acetyltransferase complex protein AlgJ
MLRRDIRLWLPLVAALLFAPLIVQLCSDTNTLAPDENRALAPLPQFPRSLKDLKGWPGRFDAYLRDHFGFRDAIIRAHTWITQITQSQQGNSLVLLANDGWMFYRGEHMLEQSAGQIMRRASLEHTVDILADMNNLLAARGSKLIVASPPNSATIYFDKIDGWPRHPNEGTEYDVQMGLLTRRNIMAVDLRPVLQAERARGETYLQHDTHWNARGAITAFNAIAAKSGLREWRIDPLIALGPDTRLTGGDLARMLGIANYASELDRPFQIADSEKVTYSMDPIVYEMRPKAPRGPTVLIIGDSFTDHRFPPMIAANGGRAIWIHHQFCRFDWQWVEKFRPDQVWYMPTERYFPCDPKRWPQGMPATQTTMPGSASLGRPQGSPPDKALPFPAR